jgi:hypothetical protein
MVTQRPVVCSRFSPLGFNVVLLGASTVVVMDVPIIVRIATVYW